MTAYVQQRLPDVQPTPQPERVEAVQWHGLDNPNLHEVQSALPEVNARLGEISGRLVVDTDSSGTCFVRRGWYIGRTSTGYRFVQHPDHFEDRYRRTEESA